jgi:hypothetical protein
MSSGRDLVVIISGGLFAIGAELGSRFDMGVPSNGMGERKFSGWVRKRSFAERHV